MDENRDLELAIETRYDAVSVTEEGLQRIQEVKQVAEAVAQLTEQACAPHYTRELAVGLTQLEIAVHCIVRAIALANQQEEVDVTPTPLLAEGNETVN